MIEKIIERRKTLVLNIQKFQQYKREIDCVLKSFNSELKEIDTQLK